MSKLPIAAFPGHAVNCLRSNWTLVRWRSLARTMATLA